MRRPRALDLFCGAGGAALGLVAAGFEVVGIDVDRRCARVYPAHFVLGDALNPPLSVGDFDFVWASPPCQRWSSATTRRKRDSHPDHIGATRLLLAGHPRTCIENVPRAPIRADLRLNGPSVGLPLIERMRLFELSFRVPQPALLRRIGTPLPSTTERTYNAAMQRVFKREGVTTWRVPLAVLLEAMGITTAMTGHQVGEAVPPPMAEYIGRYALRHMAGERFGLLE